MVAHWSPPARIAELIPSELNCLRRGRYRRFRIIRWQAFHWRLVGVNSPRNSRAWRTERSPRQKVFLGAGATRSGRRQAPLSTTRRPRSFRYVYLMRRGFAIRPEGALSMSHAVRRRLRPGHAARPSTLRCRRAIWQRARAEQSSSASRYAELRLHHWPSMIITGCARRRCETARDRPTNAVGGEIFHRSALAASNSPHCACRRPCSAGTAEERPHVDEQYEGGCNRRRRSTNIRRRLTIRSQPRKRWTQQAQARGSNAACQHNAGANANRHDDD